MQRSKKEVVKRDMKAVGMCDVVGTVQHSTGGSGGKHGAKA